MENGDDERYKKRKRKREVVEEQEKNAGTAACQIEFASFALSGDSASKRIY